jgi:hypothetical protein
MRAGRRDDNDARARIFVNIADNGWQFVPECTVHIVALFRSVQNNMRDIFLDRDVENTHSSWYKLL